MLFSPYIFGGVYAAMIATIEVQVAIIPSPSSS
jgi:hypothetical protein